MEPVLKKNLIQIFSFLRSKMIQNNRAICILFVAAFTAVIFFMTFVHKVMAAYVDETTSISSDSFSLKLPDSSEGATLSAETAFGIDRAMVKTRLPMPASNRPWHPPMRRHRRPTHINWGDSDDTITIKAGTTISKTVNKTADTTAAADVVAVDAGNGNNTVSDYGTVAASASATAQAEIGSASQATAGSTAVKTGNGSDIITNASTITSIAVSRAETLDISLILSGPDSSDPTQSIATANGIFSGAGNDTLTNTGLITSSADATVSSNNVEVQVTGLFGGSASTTAEATAVGMDGGSGSDAINNEGSVSATAKSDVTATGVSLSFLQADIITRADTKTNATATATGISGGDGNDIITSSGPITSTAEATVLATDVSLELYDFSMGNSSATSTASAYGIKGESGLDSITNSGKVTVAGASDVNTNDINVKNSSLPTDPLEWLGADMGEAKTSSQTAAVGLAGGADDDVIINSGDVSVNANADAQSNKVDVEVSIPISSDKKTTAAESQTVSVSSLLSSSGAAAETVIASATSCETNAVVDAGTTAQSTAAGLTGDDGNDIINNSGKLSVNTKAEADSVSVGVTISQERTELLDLLGELGLTETTTSAGATASGITGGAGSDLISNTGEISVEAEVDTSTTAVGIRYQGDWQDQEDGDTGFEYEIGSTLLRSGTTASASATGIEGGEDDDTIINDGIITVNATPDASSTSVAATVVIAKGGLVAGASYADAATETTAEAAGVNVGAGNDYVTNYGQINVTPEATATSASVSATVTGAMKKNGLTAGVALTDGSTTADSNAAGIDGGDGDDTIYNYGTAIVNSKADADSVKVSVDLGVAAGKMGLIGGASYANAETTADATAYGIDGGTGYDNIANSGQLTVGSTALATSVSVGLTAQGVTGTGAAVGLSLVDGTTNATSDATGMGGGADDDTIVNSGITGVTAISDSNSASISVAISAAKEGVAVGGSFADATTKAQSTATGIDGDAGADQITNAGSIGVTADSDSSSASVGVSAAGTMTGVSADAALADAMTTATSGATGITSGAGNDVITNAGTITAGSSAYIAGASVTVNLGFAETGLTAGVAAADATINADATTVGIYGDADDDSIYNSGNISATAESTIKSADVSVNAGVALNGVAAGAALADGETFATAAATGMEGGTGNDTLANWGFNNVSAIATATSASVGVDLEGTSAGLAAGASVVDGDNTVSSLATGSSGGDGKDNIYNFSQTVVNATTNSTRSDVSVTGTFALEGVAAGASFADASNTATAAAVGIDGGAGNDTLVNDGALQANAKTTATTTNVSVDVNISGSIVSAGASLVNSDTTSTALATGIAGGAGNDRIENQSSGVISGTADATAKATGVSVDISLASFSSADITTTADADFTGINSGSGADTLINWGTVDIDAISTGTGQAGSGTIAGYGSADVSLTSTATATGLAGGDDNDKIYNLNSIDASSNATAKGVSVTAELLGAGFAAANTTSSSYAAGLSGDGGADTVENMGSINLTSTSDVNQTGVSVTLAGYSDSDGSSLSEATITGIEGGSGADFLTNYSDGVITGTATAKAETVSVGVNLLGAANADGTSTTSANAFGTDGGGGKDTLINLGTVDIDAISINTGNSGGGSLIGYGEADVSVTSTSKTIALAGGDDDDRIYNLNLIDALSNASAKGLSVTAELLGAGFAGANTTASSYAVGLSGDGGADTVENMGSINLTSTSDVNQTGVSVTLAGYSDSDGSSLSEAAVTGMDGGNDEDYLANYSDGVITATASATAEMGSVNITLLGATDADGTSAATARAIGMDGGSGNDTIYNYGKISVTSGSTLTASSQSYKLIGKDSESTNGQASASAVGIDGGDGANKIINTESAGLTVKATADVSSKNSSKTLAGKTWADADSNATATSTGITGGTGNDIIVNRSVDAASQDGSEVENGIQVYAETSTMASSDTWLFAGYPTSISTSNSTTTAVGVDAGEGHNLVVNDGLIIADALAETMSYSEADTDFLKTSSTAESYSNATISGIKAGNGCNKIFNGQNGVINASSVAKSKTVTITITFPIFYPIPIEVPIEFVGAYAVSDEDAHAKAVFTANAVGIQSGTGNNYITNLGAVAVTSNAAPDALASASSTQYTATSIAEAGGSANATGIATGDGNSTINNDGTISVTAANAGTALANYKATHLDHAVAYAGAGDVSLTSDATGIMLGEGVNVIKNCGNITVASNLTAKAEAHSNTDYAKNRGDAYAGGTANATGISTGNSQDTIKIYGNMDVSTAAIVSASGYGENYATARANSYSNATGINAGDGNNIIEVDGMLSVNANSSATAYVSIGSDSVAEAIATAIGIQTGSGNDIVKNYGTITTTQSKNSVSASGIAIATGAGHDTVTLGENSATTGSIYLGEGDDTLKFLGTAAVYGDIDPGIGSNTLVFNGAGTLGYDFTGFENTVKQGSGTFTLTGLSTMKSLKINEGTLRINSGYTMGDDSTFRTYINDNGTSGLLSVEGTVSLAGGLTVTRRPGYFHVGSRSYDIITAGSVTGVFTSVALPKNKPLLNFAMQQTDESVQVLVEVKSFKTVASNPNEKTVAGYLDRIQDTQSPDLLTVLGEIQNLSSGFAQAFSSMSPASIDTYTKTSFIGSSQITGSLQRRMSNVRSYVSAKNSESKPLLLAFAGSDEDLGRFFASSRLSQQQTKNDIWLNAYQQWGNQKAESGFTGFDYSLYGGTLGFDHNFPNNIMMGISVDLSKTGVDLDNHWGNGDIKNLTGSLYGSYFTGNAYIEGALSYGENRYSNHRYLTIGSINRRADSDHSGDVYSAYLGGGYSYNVSEWAIVPFGSFKYVYLNEEGFTETGADSVNLIINRRKTDSLISELGLRVARVFKLGSGNLIPELTGALNYDFDIDDRVITASFSGSPDATFSVEGQEVEQYGATGNIGLTFIHNKGLSTSLKYNGEFRNKYQSHGIMGQLRIPF